MGALERAIYDEVERRISSEEQFREQVDAKLKLAVDRISDATETELARLYRRVDADLANRLDTVSREIASLTSSVSKLNRQIEIVTVENRQNQEKLIRLEKRSDSSQRSQPTLLGASELGKLQETAQSYMKNADKAGDLSDVVARKFMTRVESIEGWLKENLTPEILRLKESIKSEQILREENDREIMQIVSQYTDIMRRHFESLTEGESSDSSKQLPKGKPWNLLINE
jgi:G3E family GTPase